MQTIAVPRLRAVDIDVMPRSRYAVTPADQLRVRELAAIGMSNTDIAAQLRLPLAKLQKVFRLELLEGAADGREDALKKLHDIAKSGKNFNALTFWVKARCGWRDTGTTQSTIQVIRHAFAFSEEKPKKRPPESDPPGINGLPNDHLL